MKTTTGPIDGNEHVFPTTHQDVLNSEMATSEQHHELCRAASRWLRRSAEIVDPDPPYWNDVPHKRPCGVVLSELMTSTAETPDAIGWFCGGRFSILVEAKVSRSDFRADQKKRFRKRPSLGVGDWRYYLSPPGVIPVDDLPELWGLLERHGQKVVVVRHALRHPEVNKSAEQTMLWSFARRVQAKSIVEQSER